MNKNGLKAIMISGWILICLCACDYLEMPMVSREDYLSNSPEDVVVAIIDSSNLQNGFIDGVKLAIDEINQLGVLGKKIRAEYYDDKGLYSKGLKIAKKIARNPKVMAVIGHNCSHVATATSITYENNGIVFISPGATDPDLIQNQNKYIFRTIPSGEQLTNRLVEYANHNHLKKMAVIFDNDNEMKQLANFFITQFSKNGGQIINTRSYISWETNFKNIIHNINQAGDYDALFISGKLPSAALFIKQAREMDIHHPILATNDLDSIQLFQIAGEQAKNIILPTFFDPLQPVEKTRLFVRMFVQKYGTQPDAFAASGYDAILLIADAIEKSGSFLPVEIATTLHLIQDFHGVTGTFSMNENGGIKSKAVFVKKSSIDDFQYVERKLFGDININVSIKDLTIRIPIEGSIPTVDPGLTESTSSIDVTEQLFLGLTDFEPETLKPVPELAASWTVDANYQNYTFFLRQDVLWTDGKPVTARDIQWAILRNLNKKTHSPYAYTLHILKNADAFDQGTMDQSNVGVKVIDDYTISFQLNKSAPYFPSMAGLWVFRPLPKHIITQYPDSWTNPDKIVSNGSYTLAAWEKGLIMILRKNKTYFDAKNVSIPEIRYIVISNGKLGMEMYRSDEIDLMGGNYLQIPFDYISDISRNPGYKNQYFKKEIHCSYAFALNTQKKPFDNVWVRKAINAAIDRYRIIKYITKGNQQVANNFTPQLSSFFETRSFDPVKAHKWLAQAGYPDGKNFPEIVIAFNQSETHEQIARGIQKCLKYYLNVHARLKPMPWEGYIDNLKTSNDWHLIRFGWCADYPDPNNWLNDLFHPNRSDNVIRWHNDAFMELMNAVDQTNNFSERMDFYHQAEHILCKEFCGIVPVFFETSHYLINPRIKGWYHMPLGGQHIRNWSLQ
jgi:ABC-type oligopeptide transport system substrate-binding subunit/ABC-type branched-subunit amino acid transport system substrate-binding protein